MRPRERQELIDLGMQHYYAGRLEESLTCFNKLLSDDQKDGLAWNNRAHLLNRMGRPKEALRCVNNALEFLPDNGTVWQTKVEVLLALGRRGEALAACKTWAEKSGGDPEALRLLATLDATPK